MYATRDRRAMMGEAEIEGREREEEEEEEEEEDLQDLGYKEECFGLDV